MSHDDCVVFVVVVERWKRKVGGGWIVGLFVCFVFFFFSLCCSNLWLWLVGQWWKWLLLLCCDGFCGGCLSLF